MVTAWTGKSELLALIASDIVCVNRRTTAIEAHSIRLVITRYTGYKLSTKEVDMLVDSGQSMGRSLQIRVIDYASPCSSSSSHFGIHAISLNNCCRSMSLS